MAETGTANTAPRPPFVDNRLQRYLTLRQQIRLAQLIATPKGAWPYDPDENGSPVTEWLPKDPALVTPRMATRVGRELAVAFAAEHRPVVKVRPDETGISEDQQHNKTMVCGVIVLNTGEARDVVGLLEIALPVEQPDPYFFDPDPRLTVTVVPGEDPRTVTLEVANASGTAIPKTRAGLVTVVMPALAEGEVTLSGLDGFQAKINGGQPMRPTADGGFQVATDIIFSVPDADETFPGSTATVTLPADAKATITFRTDRDIDPKNPVTSLSVALDVRT
ncbi:hypothetical protein [Streptomyces sp. NPDC051546]|uniref:hypothetical protein n=1 Tax=Streptomyces sp. NPDC051546 TaxID=3365655 RepID=UPI0037AB3718